MPSDIEKKLAWFILREIPFLGNRTCYRLIQHFKTPRHIFAASKMELEQVRGITSKQVQAVLSWPNFRDKALKEIEKVAASGTRLVTLDQETYPPLLKQIHDPPPLLTYRGNLGDTATAPCIAIVGSRRATAYGLNTARHLAGALARNGFTIVSGMASGIDSAAHEGALAAGGNTFAVLGCGLNRIYPRQNQKLYQDICKSGAVISEFALDTEPLGHNFPVRNRIIAGLSTGTLVVEAEKRSGSLITARLSGEYNREVFAVPGSIKSKKSEGTHALLKQGARLVENEQDILDELHHLVHKEAAAEPLPDPPQNASKNLPAMDKDQRLIYKMLDNYPRHIDEIIAQSGLESRKVAAVLLDFELNRIARRDPGNYFSLF